MSLLCEDEKLEWTAPILSFNHMFVGNLGLLQSNQLLGFVVFPLGRSVAGGLSAHHSHLTSA